MAKAEAHKLKSGTWRCKANYTDELGKHHQKSFTAKTKREAEMKVDAFLQNINYYKEPTNKSLGMLMDMFIANRSDILSPSTIVGYEKIRRTAFPNIIDVPVSKLTAEIYQKAINSYTKEHSAKSVLNAHSFAKTVLNNNDIPIANNVSLPQKIKKEKEIPDEESLRVFLTQIVNLRIYLPCLMASFLGLRHSEIYALQWKDIDAEKKTVSITKARVRDTDGQYVLKTTKTPSSRRVLPIPQIIIDTLPERGNDEDFIFQSSIKALDSEYKRACKKFGFSYSFHSLRHFYASYLLSMGMPNKYAQERMGHATPNMLTEIYQHTFRSISQEYDDMLNSAFSSFLSNDNKE